MDTVIDVSAQNSAGHRAGSPRSVSHSKAACEDTKQLVQQVRTQPNRRGHCNGVGRALERKSEKMGLSPGSNVVSSSKSLLVGA